MAPSVSACSSRGPAQPKHRHTNKVPREQRADAVNQLVAGAGQASLVVASPRWWPMPAARGEKIVKSVPRSRLHLELAIGDRFTDLVVGDTRARRRRLAGLVRLDLLVAPPLMLAGGGGVVPVAIDDHGASCSANAWHPSRERGPRGVPLRPPESRRRCRSARAACPSRCISA